MSLIIVPVERLVDRLWSKEFWNDWGPCFIPVFAWCALALSFFIQRGGRLDP
jgi:hypothetical protein